MTGLYSFGEREPPEDDETATRWIVSPEGPTTWQNGGRRARRLRQDEAGAFTYETSPDRGQREAFAGEVP